jgi:hypothetical protein
MADASRDGQQSGWAIAVVHGVGSPQRGETLKEVCAAIQEVKPEVVLATPKAIPDGNGGHVEVVSGRVGTERIRAAEAYWGDISLVRNRVRTLMRALLINLFGLRYLCQRALVNAPWIMRALSTFPFQLTRGVIIPVHLLAVGLALPIGTWQWLSHNYAPAAVASPPFLTTYDKMFLALCIAYTILGVSAAIWMKLLSRSTRSRPWDIALLFGVFAAASALCCGDALLQMTASLPTLKEWLATHSVAAWVAQCLTDHPTRPDLNQLGIIVNMLVQRISPGEAACLLVTNSTPITDGAVTGIGKYLAINEFIGDTAFFFITVDVLLLLLASVLFVMRAGRKQARAAVLALTAVMLFVVLTAIVLEPIDFIVRLVQRPGAASAYWYELLFIPWIVVLVGATAIVISYRNWRVAADRRQRRPAHAEAANPYPRLIVSKAFQTTVIASTSVLILVFLAFSSIPEKYYSVSISWRLAAPAMLVLVFALILSSERLRWGLNFAMDVVNHFSEPGRNYPVRRQISDRLARAIKVLLQDSDCRRLLIIAHSQGTVITLEALVQDLWARHLKGRIDSLTIMTFGSPWSHIYQHYFAIDYPEIAGESLRALAEERAVRWINVFRLDDVIGTKVTVSLRDFPVGVAMPYGGHGAYWCKEVLGAEPLCTHLPGATAETEGPHEDLAASSP